ncbi:DNA sulfur modification protein DndD [Mesorhizobium sp.]|uniref:DNA sulfur modification protein DndD n=1 Tax=Mesorhizobium sp. TaxID=1871066 RepID=UPI00120A33A6|nr:DNA sulfur modification protein DndD [Mesorhizobium sp.]TIM38449.1 MAG: DNA sulfur modification protein DndD [Mesorhizobium sp.]
MWVSKIELVCFKSYQRQEFEFPEPTNGRNVILIGGMNGYGKTSILEALYLCLYGKDAIAHLARAGLKADDSRGYPTFLEKAFNGEALRDGRDTMLVRVVINKTKTKAVEITRKWYFRSNGAWTDEEATFRDVIRGVPEIPKSDGKNGFHLSDILDEIFVPAHIAPFFFFDGEEVKKLADQGRVEQVKQGLEGLLGVVLLRTLADRLRNFERSKREAVANVDEERLASLFRHLTENERLSADLRKRGADAKETRDRLEGEFQSLLERVTSAGGGGGDTATYKDLVEEREQVRNRFRESQRKLEEILAGRLPFHLVSKEVMTAFQNQLEAECRYFQWDAEKRALQPRQLEFESAYAEQTSPEIEPALSAEQFAAIKARMNAAWARLFYPPPDDCADEVVYSYLAGSERDKTLSFLQNLSLGHQEIQEILNEQSQQSARIDDLGRRISRLEGIDRDGTLATLTRELKAVQDKITQLDDEWRGDERKLIALESQISSQRAEYERERKKLDDSSPARSIMQKSERVRRVLDDVVPALFPLKVKELAAAMTQVYKQLAHKDQVGRIEIKDDGSTVILGKSGKSITFDRSAGENQIFATALIAALAKVSGVKAPLVVDTPLGRLDSRHRHNILQFWTSEKTRQVILLSQDEEIDAEFKKRISLSISKTYLLDHLDVGDGIGRTTAHEDAYFMEARS